MLSGFKPISIMGASNSDVFVADKDQNDMELKFLLVRPELESPDEQECQTCYSEDRHLNDQKQEEEQRKEDDKEEEQSGKGNIGVQVASNLKIEIASDDIDDPNSEDGLKTPTSRDQKIPVTMECPAAPRKPKSTPTSSRKRKAGILLVDHDLLQDIESLFPTKPLVQDLGSKIKKVKQGN